MVNTVAMSPAFAVLAHLLLAKRAPRNCAFFSCCMLYWRHATCVLEHRSIGHSCHQSVIMPLPSIFESHPSSKSITSNHPTPWKPPLETGCYFLWKQAFPQDFSNVGQRLHKRGVTQTSASVGNKYKFTPNFRPLNGEADGSSQPYHQHERNQCPTHRFHHLLCCT